MKYKLRLVTTQLLIWEVFSEAFDNVWHDGTFFKLKTYGAKCEIFSVLKNYFQNREQQVVVNGQTSEWSKNQF